MGLQLADGLIWVYGSCHAGAQEEAAAKSIPQSLRNPEAMDPAFEGFRLPWFSRYLPYSA